MIDTPAPSSTSSRRRTFWIVVAVLVVLLLLIAFLVRHRSADTPVVHPPRVGIAWAARRDVAETIRVIGTVQPIVSATVRAQQSGTLVAIDVHEGQMVHQGQRLAQIDARPYRIAIEQAQGNLARDAAQLENARLDLTRYQTLLAQSSIARQQVDAQQASVKQLAGTVMADRAALDTARLNLAYTNLVAPVSGRVGLRQADIGDYVGPSDTTGVFVVTSENPIEVSFAVPQSDLERLARAKDAKVEVLDQQSGKVLATGALVAIDNQVDAASGTMKAKARFANAGGALTPGQFVNVVATTDTLHGAVTVPVTAVRHNGDEDFVFVLGADNSVHMRKVRLGPPDGEDIAVLGGIEAGARVVETGADTLDNGMKVTPENNR